MLKISIAAASLVASTLFITIFRVLTALTRTRVHALRLKKRLQMPTDNDGGPKKSPLMSFFFFLLSN